jgi:hypothetical protein
LGVALIALRALLSACGRAITYGVRGAENRVAYTAVILGLVPRICFE